MNKRIRKLAAPTEEEVRITDLEAENARLQARVEEAKQERDAAKGLPTECEVCHSCGSAVALIWAAKDEDWNEVVGSPGGIRCAKCFAAEAERRGLNLAYIAVPLADGWRTDWYGYKALAEQVRREVAWLETACVNEDKSLDMLDVLERFRAAIKED